MSGPRPLLRLDDKVAAEGRRLKNIGGPSMRWVAPLALIAAASLHAAVLLLPAVPKRAPLPAASPAPDFPLVWRPVPAATAPPPVVLPERRTTAAPAPPEPTPKPPAVGGAVHALALEPVPEPAPEFALTKISAAFEAIIPYPDTPPPSLEQGPPSGASATAVPDAAPEAIERVTPVYPMAARSLRAEGRVTLRLAVLQDGSVGGATVEECSRPGLGFEAAALEAVKRWWYEPAPLQSGSRKVRVTIHFQRQEGPP